MSTEMCVWGGGGRGVCASREAKGRVLSVCTCAWVHVCVCVCVGGGGECTASHTFVVTAHWWLFIVRFSDAIQCMASCV